MDRTLNNPVILGAVASNEGNIEENEYIYNRSAYDTSPNLYNQLSRDRYNSLDRNIGNRASGEYGYAPIVL